MKNLSNNRPAVSSQVSQPSVEAPSENPIDHPSVVTFRMKNFDTHPCITIKWSPCSASRRRVDVPPMAAVRTAAGRAGEVGGGSC
jgi:hypothetical protein